MTDLEMAEKIDRVMAKYYLSAEDDDALTEIAAVLRKKGERKRHCVEALKILSDEVHNL